MKPLRVFKAAALAAAAVLATGNAGNWNLTVEEDGSHYIIGNPEAKVELIEFVSYTCPHCAHFSVDGDGALQLAYVGTGKVRREIRHIIRDPIDLTAALLTRCGDRQKFQRNHHAIMLAQETWLPLAAKASPAQQARWMQGTPHSRFRAIAADLGFEDIMERRGYERTEIDRCLADETAARALIAESNASFEEFGITGTPSFVLNGELLEDVHSWPALQPKLDEAFLPKPEGEEEEEAAEDAPAET